MLELSAVVRSDIQNRFAAAASHETPIDFVGNVREMTAQRPGDARKVRVVAEQDLFFDREIELGSLASFAMYNPERIKGLAACLFRPKEVIAPRL